MSPLERRIRVRLEEFSSSDWGQPIYVPRFEAIAEAVAELAVAEVERAYREGLKDGYRDAQPRSDAA